MLPTAGTTNGPPSDRQLAFLGLALLVLAFPALLLDSQVVTWTRQLRSDSSSVFLLVPVELMARAAGAAVILLILLVLEQDRRRTVLRVAVAVLLAALVTLTLKIIVARQRPPLFDTSSGIWASFQGLFHIFQGESFTFLRDRTLESFPSGHMTTAAALAVGLATLYPRWSCWFAAAIPLVALQRICHLEHFVSDTLSGAGIGILASVFVLRHRLWDFLTPATPAGEESEPD